MQSSPSCFCAGAINIAGGFFCFKAKGAITEMQTTGGVGAAALPMAGAIGAVAVPMATAAVATPVAMPMATPVAMPMATPKA